MEMAILIAVPEFLFIKYGFSGSIANGRLYKYVTGIYAPNMIDNIVENIANNQLLAAIFAMFSIILSTYLLSQHY